MKLSVIIPTYNEEDFIGETIRTVQRNSSEHLHEIIVVDGESSDNTIPKAREAGAEVVVSPQKGRPAQMNYGAEQAQGDILYFLHADSVPPSNFDRQISERVSKGYEAGCFRLAFDAAHFLLDFYAWCTRFDIDAFRFGDQSLFITRHAFIALDGFRGDHLVMEDNEMVRRIKKSYSFVILDEAVVTSARLYHRTGVVKLQLIFMLIFVLYFFGVEQEKLVEIKQNVGN